MKNLPDLRFLIEMALVLSVICVNAQQVSRSYVDAGSVHLESADGYDHRVEKEDTQSGAEQIKIAEDRETVGWLMDYPNPDPIRSWEALTGTWSSGEPAMSSTAFRRSRCSGAGAS